MKKFAFLAAFAVMPILGALFGTQVFADSPGQFGAGNVYQVRNVTQNSAYSNSIAATCNDVVKYSFELSNTQYGTLYGVKLSANLQNNTATATATNTANQSVSVSDMAAVTVANGGTLNYVAGSTQLYTVNGQLIKNLPDGITSGGVGAGSLAGSTREFVYFQAKVDCVTPPANIQVCDLASKTIITIREDQFDAAKYSKNLADCATKPPVPGEITVCRLSDKTVMNIKENEFDSNLYTKDLSKCAVTPVVTPTELPHTGSTGGAIAIVASLLTAAAGYVVTARKNVLG